MARLPRSPILLPSREAERALFESLEAKATNYMDADDFGRQAAREALQACLKFLHDRGLSGQALKAVADVNRALDDVDRGFSRRFSSTSATHGFVTDAIAEISKLVPPHDQPRLRPRRT